MAAPKFSSSDNEAKVVFDNTHNSIVNALRRAIIDDVPTFAIEEVEFIKNESPLYDEMIAHRLGLIPLTTDLESYNMKSTCTCGGVGCALCEVKMNLSQKEPGYIYSKDITSDDPQIVPVHKEIQITKIFGESEFEMTCKAILGTGREHAKWSPAHSYLKEDGNKIELIIEPHGQLESKELYNKAVDILIEKIQALEEQI